MSDELSCCITDNNVTIKELSSPASFIKGMYAPFSIVTNKRFLDIH